MENNLAIVYAGGTDKGRIRKQNEDSILMSTFENSGVILLLVADGVGGHFGGAEASKLTVEVIRQSVAKSVLQACSGGGYGADWLTLTLQSAIFDANAQVVNRQNMQVELDEMATTVVALLIADEDMVVGHLGDSRCYESSQAALIQLTEDHTVLQQMLNEGRITQYDFENMPMHHVISRAIGLNDSPDIQMQTVPFNLHNIYLLCSDGLTDCVSDAQIKIILNKSSELADAVDALITCANDNGGTDNISVVLVKGASINS